MNHSSEPVPEKKNPSDSRGPAAAPHGAAPTSNAAGLHRRNGARNGKGQIKGKSQQQADAELKNKPIEALYHELSSGPKGLSSQEAEKRLAQYGPNALEESKQNQFLKFLGYFWGPIPWMIEIAAILSAAVGHWVDLGIILFLLVFNAVIGFWEEHEANNALEDLKSQLALQARAIRDGKWQEVPAEKLVPGDMIRLRIGDIIPADIKLSDGDYLSIDQSALTGESLPVTKKSGDIAYSGSVVKQGEMAALVTGTGPNTYFAKTAKLVEEAGAVSHFQQAVMRVGDFLIFLSIGLSVVLIAIEMLRELAFIKLIEFVLIVVVASIPVAMPAVLSVTMALGALALSRKKAIVSRLQAIEEMAGIDILCSDKTGTLTQNKLKLGDLVTFEAAEQELMLAAALASKEENQDAIDMAVLQALPDKSVLEGYRQTRFVPFDPVNKKTEATVETAGRSFEVSKGAPQVIFDLCRLDPQKRQEAEKVVADLAAKGYRTLGVARAQNGETWKLLGILPLYDPPRDDSADTIAQAGAHGIAVKMITGDNVAIAREIAGKLGMRTHIQPARELFSGEARQSLSHDAEIKIEKADGFAEVFPEHKYSIVKALQDRGHLVGMTGDGVNDAPALKQADVGIAVSGAANAARSAAALVLTEPGLSVIIQAVQEARRIFERMLSYTIYRIAMTVNIMFFVVAAMIAFNEFPLTPFMIIILALLDDIPIMTIAYDNTHLRPNPVRWEMNRVITLSSVLGFLATAETFTLLIIGRRFLNFDVPHLQTMMFLQLVAGGHLMLFVTRMKRSFWRRPFPSWQLASAIIGTQLLAVAICGFGWVIPALPWKYIGYVYAYNLIWMVFLDVCKLGLYQLIENRSTHKRRFLGHMNRPLHAFREIF